MFREAARAAIKKQGRRYQWLCDQTGIPMSSILAYMGNTGKGLSVKRVERIFEVLRIKVVVSED